MKKNVLRILAAILALTMVFSMAACGNDDKGSSSAASTGSSETSSAADDSSSEESSAADSSSEASAADGKFATVKAFLEDPDTKSQLDATIEQMMAGDDDTMSVSLDGTDDTLIYNFKFSDDAMAATDEETLKTALVEGLEAEDFVSTFEGIAASLSAAIEADNIKVKVVYAKADGTELASREYSAK